MVCVHVTCSVCVYGMCMMSVGMFVYVCMACANVLWVVYVCLSCVVCVIMVYMHVCIYIVCEYICGV